MHDRGGRKKGTGGGNGVCVGEGGGGGDWKTSLQLRGGRCCGVEVVWFVF